VSGIRGKVIHLSSAHKANDVRIFHKECRSLAKAGYDVTLIARADEDGKAGDVKIRAVKSGVGNRFVRMTRAVNEILRMALNEDGNIYHFHDPELIPAGLVLKLRGKRVIYDAHEDVPGQILTKFWIPTPLRPLIAWLFDSFEKFSVRRLDWVITATEGIARKFPPEKTTVIQNFPMLDEFAEFDSRGPTSEVERKIVYTGGLTEIRGARQMVKAMELLGAKNVRLTIAGSIKPAQLESELRQMPGWRYVDYVGWQGREAVIRLLTDARAGLLLFLPAPNHAESQPNKLFEYMSAGLPVIASDFTAWEQFIEDPGAGLMVDPRDASAVAQTVLWILDHPKQAGQMGKRGREAVLDRYSWDHEAEKLLALYRFLSS
jgi:glycosyltransferase involved in cell wall biosynthesis